MYELCSRLENDGAFAEHVATHTTSKDVYLCTTCGYTAKLNNSIAAHSKLHNPDVKKIPCNICGTKYATMQLYEVSLTLSLPPPSLSLRLPNTTDTLMKATFLIADPFGRSPAEY